MKAISTGNIFEIYDDNLLTYDQLPVQAYTVRFSKLKGFFLEKHADMEIRESKIYGKHVLKVQKVLNAFDNTDRNLGVILSGAKGIGKSLFAKLLSLEAMQKGHPVIIIDTYYPGIASYIESIEQETVVLFDEFDKTFGEVRASDGEASPQTGLLSLFDGISSGRKLYVITCNNLRSLNEYLINRPGRFHYHFRFDCPEAEEVREYLRDKIIPEWHGEIESIVSFARKVDLNFDCLRAIAFEINMGTPFKEAIKDLNIIHIDLETYIVKVRFKNGVTLKSGYERLDLFGDEAIFVSMYNDQNDNILDVEFDTPDCVYDGVRGTICVLPEDLRLVWWDESEKRAEQVEQLKQAGVADVTIERKGNKSIHYAV